MSTNDYVKLYLGNYKAIFLHWLHGGIYNPIIIVSSLCDKNTTIKQPRN